MQNPRIVLVDIPPALERQVRRIAARMRPHADVSVYERLEHVVGDFDSLGSVEVLIAGPRLTDAGGLQRVAETRAELPATSIVLVLDAGSDVGIREVLHTGAVDALTLPVDDASVKDTIERAIELATAVAQKRADSGSGAEAGEHHGRIIAVTSGSGGSGKTFLATNLAFFLSNQHRYRTCVVDADLQFGGVPTALRLKPRNTIVDAVEDEGEDGDGDGDRGDLTARRPSDLDALLTAHETGFQILAPPKDPSAADRVKPQDVTRVLLGLRSRFDVVVADTPTGFGEVSLAVLDASDVILILATLDMPSIRNLGVYLGTLEKLGISPESVRLVLNKVEANGGVDVDQVLRLFPQVEQGSWMALPYAHEVTRSLNNGTPLLSYLPRLEISKDLARGFDTLLHLQEGRAEGDETKAHARGVSRILRRVPKQEAG